MVRNDNGTVTLSGIERVAGFVAMICASGISVGGFVMHTTNRITVIETRQDSDREILTDHGHRITQLEANKGIEK